MKCNEKFCHISEFIIYALLAVFILGIIYYLYYFHPIDYIRLITEDQVGEYTTSISFALAGILMIRLIRQKGNFSQKALWLIIGLAALFIAGEEISWGQRIFNLSTPDILRQINVQEELSLHNIRGIAGIKMHMFAGYLIMGWSVFSALLSIFFPRLRNSMMKIGLPIIPLHIIPMFLVASYFSICHPIVKSSEIGELCLGIAAAVWAFDLALHHNIIRLPMKLPKIIAPIGMLLMVLFIAVLMTSFFPGDLRLRLNVTASRDYPSFKMYNQAQAVYEYIYSHPRYLATETWFNHCKMLIKTGQQEEANRLLVLREAQRAKELRQQGIIFKLLKQHEQADAALRKALEADKNFLDLVSDSDSKARILFSMAQTLKTQGNFSAAIEMAKMAHSEATAAYLHHKINRWIKCIENFLAKKDMAT